jgi:hypothetical protein
MSDFSGVLLHFCRGSRGESNGWISQSIPQAIGTQTAMAQLTAGLFSPSGDAIAIKKRPLRDKRAFRVCALCRGGLRRLRF